MDHCIDPQIDHQSAPQTVIPDVAWCDRDRGNSESRLDIEASVALRCFLSSTFTEARSWPDLLQSLSRKGFDLMFQGDRLTLTCKQTHVTLCTCRYLGFSFRRLAASLGKPAVLAGSLRLIPYPFPKTHA